MEFPFSPAEKELRDSIRTALRSLPSPPIGESGADGFPPGLRDALRSAGLFDLGAGGGGEPEHGLPAVLHLIEIARVSPGLAAALAVHNFLCRRYVRRSGRRSLPDGLGGWCLGERAFGELAASPSEGGWDLNGRQVVLGPPGFLDWLIMSASVPGPEGVKVESVFVVDRKHPGITIGPTGAPGVDAEGHGIPEAVFDNVALPAGCLLGCPGDSGIPIREIITGADGALAGLCSGIAGFALAHCLEAASGKGRGRHPGRGKKAHERLAESLIELETVRFLTFRAALRSGAGEGRVREAREAAERGLNLVPAAASAARERLAPRSDSAAYLADLDSAVAAARLWADLRGV